MFMGTGTLREPSWMIPDWFCDFWEFVIVWWLAGPSPKDEGQGAKHSPFVNLILILVLILILILSLMLSLMLLWIWIWVWCWFWCWFWIWFWVLFRVWCWRWFQFEFDFDFDLSLSLMLIVILRVPAKCRKWWFIWNFRSSEIDVVWCQMDS